MTGETQHDEEPDDASPQSKQPASQEQEAGRRLGEAFRQELDQAIQPVVETIRSQIGPPLQQDDEEGGQVAQETRSQSASLGPEQTQVLTLALDRQQAEQALRGLLDSLIDSLFSDALRDAMRQKSEETIHALIMASRKSLSKGQSLNEEQQQLVQSLDDMLGELFSESARADVRRRGESVVRKLLQWDAPSARSAGDKAILTLSDQRITAFNNFWKQTLEMLLKVSRQAGEQTSRPAGRGGSSSPERSSTDEKVPQTVLRSDKRAQTIWKKAYDKAAGKDGQGRGAERAAYDALKVQYEKKGDRWVKKAR